MYNTTSNQTTDREKIKLKNQYSNYTTLGDILIENGLKQPESQEEEIDYKLKSRRNMK